MFNNNQKSVCISGLEKKKNNFSKPYPGVKLTIEGCCLRLRFQV